MMRMCDAGRASFRRRRGLLAALLLLGHAGVAVAASQVAGGGAHTCAVTTAGGLKCWGNNVYGQLGEGSTTTERLTAVNVSGLATGVTAASGGHFHTCALTAAGGVKCWGYNGLGQLGDGTATNRSTPVSVSGLTSGVARVSAGFSHTCALTSAGGLKCWGYNFFGELGDGTRTMRRSPVDVSGLTSGVAAVASGGQHTCALTTAGGVKCWGDNTIGELGDGTTTLRTTPGDVSGLTSGVVAIATGHRFSCALTTAGGVKCWGENNWGQLGVGPPAYRFTPTDVTGLTSGVVAIAAGQQHACALTTAGGLKCWGDNDDGELGDGTTTYRPAPVDVIGLGAGVVAVDAGELHTCAIVASGAVKCWGENGSGQLGNGTGTAQATPVGVSGLASGVTAVNAGWSHTCAVRTGGTVQCWGYNTFGELGDGMPTTTRLTPIDVIGLTSPVASTAAGVYSTCVLTTSGGVGCWGANVHGQLGDGTTTDRLTSTDVVGLTSGAVAVSAGLFHTCALTMAGAVQCWGFNNDGELGDGTTADRSTPVVVTGLTTGTAAVAAGQSHTCALTTAGGVKCWGYNAFSQLGDGTVTRRLTPVDVSGLASGAVAVTAGTYHSCALTAAGGVKCWGNNSHGELGDGTATSRLTAVNVSGLTSGVAAIVASDRHTCALTTVGGVKCWGDNSYGQLGDSSTANRLTPVNVTGLTSGAAAVTAGDKHTCALTSSGGVLCWGDNYYGEVGYGETGFYPFPTDALGVDCGDGALDPTEECDDGGQVDGDGCSALCRVEPAWSCDGRPSMCTPICGDGLIVGNEPCDLGAGANGTAGVCCSFDCRLAPAGTICRPASTECDLAETCSGSNPTCPADALKPAGTECADDGNPCTRDECDGTSVCRHPAGNAGAVCRGAIDVCDVAEACTGASTSCPADAKEPTSTVCRPATSDCDMEETCDGAADTCPTDGFRQRGTPCADGACDGAGTCVVTTITTTTSTTTSSSTTSSTTSNSTSSSTTSSTSTSTSSTTSTSSSSTTSSTSTTSTSTTTSTTTSSSTTTALETTTTSTTSSTTTTLGCTDGDGDGVCDGDDLCPAVVDPTQADADGDGLGDACDPCTNVAGARTASKAKVSATRLLPPPGDDVFKLSGVIVVPTTPAIDPAINGLRVVYGDGGRYGNLFDQIVPGGAYDPSTRTGWMTKNWSFTYRTGAGSGLYRVKLKADPRVLGQYKVQVKGKNGSYAGTAGDLPVNVAVVIDRPYATTGQCGEWRFPATPPAKPSCVLNTNGSVLKCK